MEKQLAVVLWFTSVYLNLQFYFLFLNVSLGVSQEQSALHTLCGRTLKGVRTVVAKGKKHASEDAFSCCAMVCIYTFPFKGGFSTSAPLTFGSTVLCCGGYPGSVECLLASLPSTHWMTMASPYWDNCRVSRCCQTSPGDRTALGEKYGLATVMLELFRSSINF